MSVDAEFVLLVVGRAARFGCGVVQYVGKCWNSLDFIGVAFVAKLKTTMKKMTVPKSVRYTMLFVKVCLIIVLVCARNCLVLDLLDVGACGMLDLLAFFLFVLLVVVSVCFLLYFFPSCALRGLKHTIYSELDDRQYEGFLLLERSCGCE